MTDVIHAGGAEIFILRLARALKAKGHIVVVCVLHSGRVDFELAAKMAASIPVVDLNIRLRKLYSFLDGILFRARVNYSLLRSAQIRSAQAIARIHEIDIVHSHLLTADLVNIELPAAHVTTLHGDYSRYGVDPLARRAARVLHPRRSIARVISEFDAIACITDEQVRSTMNYKDLTRSSIDVSLIYNGYEPDASTKAVSLAELGVPEGSFIFGMVARGIKEKGWSELIEAFRRLKMPDSYLLLVGDGEYIRSLKFHVRDDNIIFTGYTPNPEKYIRSFDVGCLPSRSENLPTAIIEYLSAGKPVIATNTGQVAEMLTVDDKTSAGIVVGVGEFDFMVESLTSAMLTMRTDVRLREQYKGAAAAAASKFKMSTCVSSYEALYIRALDRLRN
jgi:glycosyltransferase involved in cell wall biosynthesis